MKINNERYQWKHNKILTRQVRVILLGSKAPNKRKIAIDKNVSASNVSAKNKEATREVAANKEVGSKADDKHRHFEANKRREAIPAAFSLGDTDWRRPMLVIAMSLRAFVGAEYSLGCVSIRCSG